MKKTPLLLLALGAGLLSGCAATAPGQLRVHEALLYGGSQERITWVYGNLSGGSSSVRLGGAAADLRAQVNDPLATPGSLSVNGRATFRTATTTLPAKLAVTRLSTGGFNVTPNDSDLLAVYFTDGRSWQKLSGVSGAVTGTAVRGLEGVGSLTDDEARALSGALMNQGPLAVAVLDPTRVPDAPLAVEPAPTEHLRTALYVLPGVPTALVPAPTPPAPVTSAPAPLPRPGGSVTTPQPGTPQPGTALTFSEVASGTNATATSFNVQVARTASAASALYATAYGRQTGVPTPPALNGRTLVGVFLGQRNTGGYSIKVREARVSGGILTLVAEVRAPGEGSFTTQAITSPWTIVSVSGTFTGVRVVDTAGQSLSTGTGAAF